MQRYYMVVLSVEILKACLKSVFHGKWFLDAVKETSAENGKRF